MDILKKLQDLSEGTHNPQGVREAIARYQVANKLESIYTLYDIFEDSEVLWDAEPLLAQL